MRILKKHWYLFAFAGLLIFVYRRWFMPGAIIAPDFPYYYSSRLSDFTIRQYAWSNTASSGFGSSVLSSLNLDMYVHTGIRLLVFYLRLPWEISSRILIFYPFLVLGTAGSFGFVYLFLRNKLYASAGALIYLTNTYVLMMVGGGQMGLALSYAISPLVIYAFIDRRKILFTVAVFFLVLFDLRFAYLIALLLSVNVLCTGKPSEWWALIKRWVPSMIVVIGLHMFWILPYVLFGSYGIPEGYGSPGWLSYLSWAEFSKTISLLHPNWPENIFGKTYFMDARFLILPMLAFTVPLLSRGVKKEQKRSVLFWSSFALVGAFLAKGVNPPFGEVYRWMFANVPLFNGFRDPTKFYIYVALSYSILLPMAISRIDLWARRWVAKGKIRNIFGVSIFLIVWIALISQTVFGGLAGTFGIVTVPQGYQTYADRTASSADFSRTLAVPWRNPFIYESETHPVINASDLFHTTDLSKISRMMEDPSTLRLLRAYAVSYVVVPDDFTRAIFLRDRSYDESLREETMKAVGRSAGLKRESGFGDLAVYSVERPTGLFTWRRPDLDVQTYAFRKRSPVSYQVDVGSLETPVTLSFAMAYDQRWVAWAGNRLIPSVKTADGLNSFALPDDITREVTVQYTGQKYLDWGALATGMSLGGIVLVCVVVVAKKRRYGALLFFLIFCGVGIARTIYVVRAQTQINALENKSIWWSTGWKRIYDPFLSRERVVSRAGGDEFRFRVKGTSALQISVSTPNNEKDSLGIDIVADDRTYSLHNPIDAGVIRIPLGSDRARVHDVRSRIWCASSLSPCELSVRAVQVDRGASISAPDAVKDKTLAVLGDSISVSFGKRNAWYRVADLLGYHLHNASVFGSSVSRVPDWDSALDRYKRDIVAVKPEALVIFLGTNDLGRGIPLAVFKEKYESLVRGIRVGTPESRIILVGLMYRKDFTPEQILSYSGVIRETAAGNGLTYIDPYGWMDPDDLQDVVHPAPESEEKLVGLLYRELVPLLKK